MKGFYLSVQELSAAICAFKQFPETTPGRYNLVSTLINELLKAETNAVRFPFGRQCDQFNMSAEHCRHLYRLLMKDYIFLFTVDDMKHEVMYGDETATKDGFKPFIFLPSVENCLRCSKRLNIRDVPSNPVVYTSRGTSIAAMFEGKCRTCDIAYYYSYYLDKQGQEKFFYNKPDNEYFQISSKTVFEVQLLKEVETNITLSATTFESRAQLYNVMFNEIDEVKLKKMHHFSRSKESSIHFRLNKERLEEAWFYWEIFKWCESQNSLQEMNISTENDYANPGHRKDLQFLCNKVMLKIYEMPNRWLSHTCEVEGCKDGYVTIDGNEKVHRPKCAAPKECIRTGPSIPNIINCCPESPVFGNASRKPLKYCVKHSYLEKESTCKNSSEKEEVSVPPLKLRKSNEDDYEIVRTVPPLVIKLPEFKGMDPEIVNTVNLTDMEIRGDKRCNKSQKKEKKLYSKTAGILAAVKPCSIIVNIQEMITAESPTQAFFFLMHTFFQGNELKDNVCFKLNTVATTELVISIRISSG
jgi:hypothetical protein